MLVLKTIQCKGVCVPFRAECLYLHPSPSLGWLVPHSNLAISYVRPYPALERDNATLIPICGCYIGKETIKMLALVKEGNPFDTSVQFSIRVSFKLRPELTIQAYPFIACFLSQLLLIMSLDVSSISTTFSSYLGFQTRDRISSLTLRWTNY